MRIAAPLVLAAALAVAAAAQDETVPYVAVKLSMMQVQAIEEANGAEVTVEFDANQLAIIREVFEDAGPLSVVVSTAHLRDDNTLVLQTGPEGELEPVPNP
jgi:hypothetical protein